MGKMIDGVWMDEGDTYIAKDGSFQRPDSPLRNWVTADGAAGSSGVGGFKAEAGRYHLYIATSCPWAHRTQIMTKLKELEGAISFSLVKPRRTENGWIFDHDDDTHKDHVLDKSYLHEVYTSSTPDYTGRVTVPVLYDTEQDIIVSNESSEIIRMLNEAFQAEGAGDADYYPEDLRAEIDPINERVYANLNNGVYRAGYAKSQDAYDEAYEGVFDTLDWMDALLSERRYLAGDRMTEADWRAFPTLVRFDVAYVGAFRCNKQRIIDYANLWPYLRELYQQPGVAETVQFETYKRGYYANPVRNPHNIIPNGPVIDFDQPHGRG